MRSDLSRRSFLTGLAGAATLSKFASAHEESKHGGGVYAGSSLQAVHTHEMKGEWYDVAEPDTLDLADRAALATTKMGYKIEADRRIHRKSKKSQAIRLALREIRLFAPARPAPSVCPRGRRTENHSSYSASLGACRVFPPRCLRTRGGPSRGTRRGALGSVLRSASRCGALWLSHYPNDLR
jgi:hypothetical protein